MRVSQLLTFMFSYGSKRLVVIETVMVAMVPRTKETMALLRLVPVLFRVVFIVSIYR